MSSLLVTGGAGFIGANFVRYLLNVDSQVQIINLDSLTYAGKRENLGNLPDESRHTFIEGDICNKELVSAILRKHVVDTVVHFAAETHVDRSILDPAPFVQTNVIGTFTLLEAARQIWAGDGSGRRFHHVSTDEVFGSLDPGDSAFTESTPYQPRSPYSASKAASDHLVRSYFHTYNMPITITNCSNNYGPYQFPEKLIPLMILNAIQGKPLPIYGDGKQVRDWLYVEDHCEAIWLVIEKGIPGETYNVGGVNQPYNIDLVKEICSILDEIKPAKESYSSLIMNVPDRLGHDRRYAMDIKKIHDDLGWKPKHDIESGLRETVKWYLDNSDWLRTVMSQDGYQIWLEENYSKRGKE